MKRTVVGHAASGVRVAIIALAILAGTTSPFVPASAATTKPIKINGYLEFRKSAYLIVDGQRIRTSVGTKFKGSGAAKSVATIPLGYEVVAQGTRQSDGTLLASKIDSKPNGLGSTEQQVLAGTDQAEQSWLKAGKIVETGQDGKEQSMGALLTSGPQVDRARRIVDRVLPSYIDRKKVRVYVVENKEWNAMAMANYSIYVFTGIMADLNDDELAVVLGHEISHAAYEHSRRQAEKATLSTLGGQALVLGSSQIKNNTARQVATTAVGLGVTTFNNSYSRDYEDQADRVGLRYVYEAGYDYRKAPALWRKFAAKYGDGSPIENFFFGNHSLSTARAAALEREIANNYRDPAKDPPTVKQAPAKK
ncbi:MAG TPA: M48 family metalloprotease [Candidatus Eisenbacteria bacterium]|nr:M48 family metalloprotease [Candidatus Eisenbacteria bacterium]